MDAAPLSYKGKGCRFV